MTLTVGPDSITGIYVGETAVTAVYLGTELVWSSGPVTEANRTLILTGAGVLSATATKTPQVEGALTPQLYGDGILSANVAVGSNRYPVALTGAGTLTAVVVRPPVIPLAGGGTLTATARGSYTVHSLGFPYTFPFVLSSGLLLSGAGVLSATVGKTKDSSAATLAGAGTLTATVVKTKDSTAAPLSGAGTLSATATRAFAPSRMTKNGSQTWATSATWVNITPWTAVNTGGYTTVLADTNLDIVVQGTKAGATLAASVPFTGGSGSRTHTIRIVRVSDSAVIVTGSGVAANSGTCTASTTATVNDGERYKVMMNSSGANSGSVTTGTPSLTIS